MKQVSGGKPRRVRLDIFVPARPRPRDGRMARLLTRVGPTWRAAPWRRLVQATALLVYAWAFLYIVWPYGPLISGEAFEQRERVPAELFLWIDPLVGISTTIAARQWNAALLGAGVILLIGIFIPRGFCGYLCPLGTTIDLFDFAVTRRFRRFAVQRVGHWANLKYYILLLVLGAAAAGVLLAGFVAAIPVLTRGVLFTLAPLQTGLMMNWAQVAPFTVGMLVSLALFAGVLLLGFLSPRFWCRYVCPSGAVLSVFNVFRATERKVDQSCIHCNKCVKVCPFDAIKEDFTTRTNDCTFCQTCGGVCPTHSIKFVARGNDEDLKAAEDPPTMPRPMSRRAVLASAVGVGMVGAMRTGGVFSTTHPAPLRPPGSVDEGHFNELCIRCGECIKACPGPVLHAASFEHGFNALWTPVAVPTIAGCHQDCNYCTQVCPTGAIVPLTLEAKRRFVMGIAEVDRVTCLPYAGESDCDLCYRECEAAGYHAIDMRPHELPVGELPPGMSELDFEQMSSILAPVVNLEACVGCGLCEYRCHSALVKQQQMLERSAIVVRPPRRD